MEDPITETMPGDALRRNAAHLVAAGAALRPGPARIDIEETQAYGSLLVAGAIRSRLGEILLQAKRITSSQLEAALTLQREGGGLLGEILLGQGWLDQETLDAALAIQAARTVA